MAKNIVERFAPYPSDEDTATAEALYRHLLVGAQAAYQRQQRAFEAYDADRSNHVLTDWYLAETGCYIATWTNLRLLRHAMGRSHGDNLPMPATADELARELVAAYEDGSSFSEWLWEWLTEAGFDPEEIDRAYDEAAAEVTS